MSCQGCTKRWVNKTGTCHTNCEEYAEQRKGIDEVAAGKQHARGGVYTSVHAERCKRKNMQDNSRGYGKGK